MPLLQINAEAEQPRLHGSGGLDDALARELAEVLPGAPVVVMVHGYRFSPFAAAHCPHRHILALKPRPGCWKALSWPRHLGFGRGRPAEGLGIGFGWQARGSIWRAWANAEHAGAALANLVIRIQKRRAGPVDIVAHSLGARVALAAMAVLPANSIGRVVLMAAAEYQSTAQAVLRSPAGRGAEVFNITSRENDLFDSLTEWLVRAPSQPDRALGAGLGARIHNWLDVQVDCADSRAALAGYGYRIPPPVRRVCHWSAYLRPGLFRFYDDLIRNRLALPLPCLRHVLPADPAPRWSNVPALPGLDRLLRLSPKASI